MKISSAFSALIAALLLTAAASAASIALAPSRNNTLIQQANPEAQLSNALGDLAAGRTNQAAGLSIRRGLVQFDVAAAIPTGATITSATLSLRDVQGLNGNRVVSLHRVLADWGAGTSYQNGVTGAAATQNDATWLYRFYDAATPAASPTWSTAGGDFDPAASGSALLTVGSPGQLFAWTSAAMTTDVQYWLDHPTTNFGWLLLGDESVNQSAKRLNGRTLNNSGDVAPVLLVTYVPEPGTGLLLVTIAVSVFAACRSRIYYGSRE